MKPRSQASLVSSKTKAEKVPLRWGGHLPLAIRIALSGTDEDGRTFAESTQTVGVDRRGARIVTSHRIAPGAEVTVQNKAVRRTAKAKVVWRGDRGSSDEPAEVVVELLEPSESGSLWGIKFPSQNSRMTPSAPATVAVSDPTASRKAARGIAFPAELDTEPIPATTSPSGRSVVHPEPQTDALVEPVDLTAELEGLTPSLQEEARRSLETLVADAASEAGEKLRRSADDAVSSVTAAADKAASELRAAKQETEAGFRTSAESYGERLAKLSASGLQEVQRLSDKLFEDFQHKMQMALDDLQQKGATGLAQSVHEIIEDAKQRSADQLQQQAQGAFESVSEDFKASVAALLDEAGKRLADVTQSSIERVAKGAQTAVEECRIRAARPLEEQAAAVSRRAESAAKSIQLAADEALARLKATGEQTETTLDAQADGFRQRLAELSASEIEGLQRQSDALLKSFESQLLQNTLQEFQQKVAQQVADQIPNITQDLLEGSAKQLQQQAHDAVGKLSEELKASKMALVNDTREQIAALTRASLESVTREVQAMDEESRRQLAQTASQCAHATLDSVRLATDEAVSNLQAALEKMQAGTEAHAEDYKKRLAEFSTCGMEELGRKAGALLGDFEARLQNTSNDFQQRSTTELTHLLGEVAERLEQGCAGQLQRRADDAVTAVNEELQASRTALVDATREQIGAVVEASLESLSANVRVTAEESRTTLDQIASRSMQAAVESITSAADEGGAGLRAAQAEARAAIDAQTREAEKRLAGLSTSGIEEFELMARERLETFKGELQSTLDGFHNKGTTELTDRLQRFAEGLQQRSLEPLQKQFDDTLQSLSGQLKASGMKLIDEARVELTDTARASLESLTAEVEATTEQSRNELAQTVSVSAREATESISGAGEEAIAKLQAAQEAMQAGFTTEAEHERKQLADLSASSIEELQRTTDSVLYGFGHSLKQRAGAASEEAGRALRETLQEVAASSLRESQSKHEEWVKKERRLFQDNIDFASQATLERLTQRLVGLEEERERRSIVPKLAWVLVAVAPTVLFVYLAARPVMRLRVDPPSQFLSAIDDVPPERRATEERLARAYWDWAFLHLQRQYPFAAELPDDPPVEMGVEGQGFPTGLQAEFTKRRYWRKLCEVWVMPQSWEKSSLWDRQ